MNIQIKRSALLAVFLIAACGQQQGPAPAEALAAAPPAGVSGAAVDVCALLDSADALPAVGKLYKPPEARPAQGSLLGQCEYFGDKLVLMVSARPAAEYRGTVDYAAKKGGSKPMAGLGSAADMTPMGLMIQPAGQPYFIVVYTMAGGKFDEATALDIGRKLKL